MSDVTIRCRQNGPFLVEGPVTIVDHLGNAFTLAADKPAVALCRCGHSAKKPFCDGSHKGCEFVAAELAVPPVA
ncbi:MAG: CDGSH iron-sulfur domain-containing protein [Planctomycetia bacterium]|nr:CDGSH iron-sulfur domain-containing protein [Planctomycetia bacterium]